MQSRIVAANFKEIVDLEDASGSFVSRVVGYLARQTSQPITRFTVQVNDGNGTEKSVSIVAVAQGQPIAGFVHAYLPDGMSRNELNHFIADNGRFKKRLLPQYERRIGNIDRKITPCS